ncbi:capsular polysaccharide biosynthesis protein [Chromobacterium vaccinii]|uniref:capsular polysaccharide biosynthesis protein n=1 Tax=Chromobacterium vaccinii TaxID=1108595 RepID=UPI001E35C135|nr:capsular polysaccharide biosynthesis protein [Chromobacterium vaccinii]MCD4483025.1 capsular polysaccharide biosynthesis protein [Chromobacterium vaccinii]
MPQKKVQEFFITSRSISKIPSLSAFLLSPIRRYSDKKIGTKSSIVVWGFRPSSTHGEKIAKKRNLPIVRLEDGFLRSLGLGVHGAPPLSLVVDDVGMFYDSTHSSLLEKYIENHVLSINELHAAQRGIIHISTLNLSKYNHTRLCDIAPTNDKKITLVLDQTKGDISVLLGGADEKTFKLMLETAQKEHPNSEIWVKIHPDVISGKKEGYFNCTPSGIRIIKHDICPQSLLKRANIVYTATSHMGFEALIAGCKVVCFGKPWYAGWGLTDDRHPDMTDLRSRRRRKCTLEELFYAAYLKYSRYIQPETGKPGTFFDVVEWIQLNRDLKEKNSGTLWCIGMSLWKRAAVKPFLKTPDNKLCFISTLKNLPSKLPQNSKLVVWGSRPDVVDFAKRHSLPLLRMEDGFLRSIGLGSDLLPPISLVVGFHGLHYSPHSSSDLEQLLNKLEIDEWQTNRAIKLRKQLVELKLSKYNIGNTFHLSKNAVGKTIVLVPGQVESDASIKAASPEINTNLALLRMVRHLRPNAWLIYKPHPDVIFGNRKGEVPINELSMLVDQTAEDADIADCLAAADEVHTMTSQTGFEALLQDKEVHCYGMPFYAGWGLTIDQLPLPQRKRQLTLNELIYGTLISYPRYIIPGHSGFARVEAVVDYLRLQKTNSRKHYSSTHWLAGQWRKVLGLLRTLL